MASCEYMAIQKCFLDLQELVIRGSIPAALFQDDLITQDGFETATNELLGRRQRGRKPLMEVLDSVRSKPAMFDKFCDALLKEEGLAKETVLKMRGETLLK